MFIENGFYSHCGDNGIGKVGSLSTSPRVSPHMGHEDSLRVNPFFLMRQVWGVFTHRLRTQGMREFKTGPLPHKSWGVRGVLSGLESWEAS